MKQLDVKLLVLSMFVQCTWTLSTSVSVSGEIPDNETFVHKTFNVPPYMRAIIEVDAYYPFSSVTKNGLYPVMKIYSRQDQVTIEEKCTTSRNGQLVQEYFYPSITTDTDYSGRLRCDRDTDMLHCRGNITIQDYKPRYYSFSFGFNCREITPHISLRGLVYNITIKGIKETECFQSPSAATCYNYFQYGMLHNLISSSYKHTSNNRLNQAVSKRNNRIRSCYQHLHKFLCNVHMPKCDPTSKEAFQPCREICHNAKNACDPIGITLQNCRYLPSLYGDVPCFNEPIWCNEPSAIMEPAVQTDSAWDGHFWHGMSQRGCAEGVMLHNITYIYNGQWSTPPSCSFSTSSTNRLRIILPLLSIVLAVILLVALTVRCKLSRKRQKSYLKTEKVNLDTNLMELNHIEIDEPLSLSKRECDSVSSLDHVLPSKRERTFDAFVLYHFDTDDSFVINQLLPELEEIRFFNLGIHSRNFTPGRDIKDNIEEAIESSNSAIIVMSQGFVDSIWCKEEFTHCYIENMKDAAFQLFVIMMQPADTLVNISPYMKTCFDTKTYLQINDPKLFTKLSTHLEIARRVGDDNDDNDDNVKYELDSDDSDEENFKLVLHQDKTTETTV